MLRVLTSRRTVFFNHPQLGLLHRAQQDISHFAGAGQPQQREDELRDIGGLIVRDAKTGEPSQRLNLDSSRSRLTIANRPGITQERDTKIYSDVCILKGQILIASNGTLWSFNTKPLPKEAHSGSDRN